MISDSELECLHGFIAAQRERVTSPLDRLWAGRCSALLVERQRLQERVEDLSREVDAALESRSEDGWASDTWVF
jgi:hypothetical protein